MSKAMVLAVLSIFPAVAVAQVVTPVPEKSVPAPAWTPPAAPPPPPPPPVEEEVATPNIVKRGSNGQVIWPERPPELVAFEAIPTTDAQKKMWNEKWTARAAQLDTVLLSNLPETLRIIDELAKIDQATEWGPAVALATPINKSFAVSPTLDQFIRSSQVLKPKQLAAYNESVKHFNTEATKDLLARANNDQSKVLLEKPREAAKQRAQEGMNAMDRMTAALAENWAKTKAALSLSGDFSAGEALVAKASDPATKAAAGMALLRAVPADRQAEVLGTFRTPVPPAPKPPADPASAGVELPKPPAKPQGGVPPTK